MRVVELLADGAERGWTNHVGKITHAGAHSRLPAPVQLVRRLVLTGVEPADTQTPSRQKITITNAKRAAAKGWVSRSRLLNSTAAPHLITTRPFSTSKSRAPPPPGLALLSVHSSDQAVQLDCRPLVKRICPRPRSSNPASVLPHDIDDHHVATVASAPYGCQSHLFRRSAWPSSKPRELTCRSQGLCNCVFTQPGKRGPKRAARGASW